VLQRRIGQCGVVYYVSAKLDAIGVRHAFSTRIGGVSPPPFDSLNLGNPNGQAKDDENRIRQNYGRLMSSIGCGDEMPLRVHQVHGRQVARVEMGRAFDTRQEADALVSRDSQRAICVRTADCVPVLLCSGDGRMVAAVHAGWRGIVAGVIPAAVGQMVELGGAADALVAAIGPCIGPAAFEVGPEVLRAFAEGDRTLYLRVLSPSAPTVDLRAAAQAQLIGSGLRPGNIDSTDLCTASRRDEFFSHRRDRGVTGRMAAVIAANSS
jgi:hypothetical protein